MYLEFVIVFSLSSLLFAQVPNSSGNLIHINANIDSINNSDTLGFWESDIEYKYSDYFDIVRTPGSLFLLRNNNLIPDYRLGYLSKEVENTITRRRQRFSFFSAIDFFSIFYLKPNTYKIKNGLWLFDDLVGIGFIDEIDSLKNIETGSGDNLYHICGQIDSLYLIIWNDAYQAKYFLMDLKNSPVLDTLDATRVHFVCKDYFGCENKIVHIEKFYGNQYFIQSEYDINLYSFESDSFRFIKTVLTDKYFQTFYYKDYNLFAYLKSYYQGSYKSRLFKYYLSLEDTTFVQEEIILEGDIFIDHSYKYAVKIDSNILQLYDVALNMNIKAWDLSNLNYCFKPLIDYPDIYFHHTKNVTSIEENKQKMIITNSFRAYPNPFNSSINIEVDFISKKNTYFKIYDLSGSLIDKIKHSGQNRVIWSPKKLSSGIYLVIYDDGKNLIKNKICYIK